MDLISAFRVFVRVGETGSFSAVAREMDVTQPAISRQVAALETYLGARLVQRTTRSVSLTEDGHDFLGPARAALQAFEQAESTVGSRHGGVAGLVRVSAPLVFGRALIAPRIHVLLTRHPELSIDLVLDDTSMNLVQDGIDVAVRIGDLATDSSYVTRKIGAFSPMIVGSAEYLASHQAPNHPSELINHDCILDDRSIRRGIWCLHGRDSQLDVPVRGRFRTDSTEAKREAIITGLGLGIMSKWLIREDLDNGTILPVLPEWKAAPVPVNAIFPSRRNLAVKTRVILDFLFEELQSHSEMSKLLGS